MNSTFKFFEFEEIFNSHLNLVWSAQTKFKIWGRSDQWLLLYFTLNILRSSFIEGHLHFKHYSILVWFVSSKFEEDPISGCFNITLWINIELLSIEGCLHFKSLQFWLGPLSISLKSEEDPMSGCWEMDVTSLYDGTGGWPGGRVGYYLESNATLWP